jgi:hypothetical protein
MHPNYQNSDMYGNNMGYGNMNQGNLYSLIHIFRQKQHELLPSRQYQLYLQ